MNYECDGDTCRLVPKKDCQSKGKKTEKEPSNEIYDDAEQSHEEKAGGPLTEKKGDFKNGDANGEDVFDDSLSDMENFLSIQRLIDSNNVQVPFSVLEGKKLIGLYFSASWCTPCQEFSESLSTVVRMHSDDLAVIMVSEDESEEKLLACLKDKPYYAASYDDAARERLVRAFHVVALPLLVILDSDGHVITKWGRPAVAKNPTTCVAAWMKGEHGVTWWDMLRFW